jgi:hypothetical protein
LLQMKQLGAVAALKLPDGDYPRSLFMNIG